MENLVGRRFGAYEIVAPLGEGGMAAVYRAFQPAMERFVALKVLPSRLAGDPQFLDRFRREARVLAGLQHPHILPVFDFGESDGFAYLVMPLIKSGTLAGRLIGVPLPPSEIRPLVSQVADALDYAHERGLVHRDVKPSNVLIDERGNCLLSDFGLAKMISGSADLTAAGTIMGTPAYMSPEQGMGVAVDGRSDIYSLGVILYEMATGRPPFRAETPMAIVYKHIHEPLPPPSSVNPSISPSLEAVILRSLAKSPDERYQTARELVAALASATALTGSLAAADPPPQTPQPPPQTPQPPPQPPVVPRRGVPAWAIGLGAVVALALLGGAWLAFGRGPAASPPAPTSAPATAEAAAPTEAPTAEAAGAQPTADPGSSENALVAMANEYLAGVQAGTPFTYDSPDRPAGTFAYTEDSFVIENGVLTIAGKPDHAVGVVQNDPPLKPGAAVAFNFQYSGEPQDNPAFLFSFDELGVPYEQGRTVAIYGREGAKMQVRAGANDTSFPMEGNLTLEPGHWYGLLMGVGPKGELIGVIWDPNDATKRLVYRDASSHQEADGFSFDIEVHLNQGTTGTLVLDEAVGMTFASLK